MITRKITKRGNVLYRNVTTNKWTTKAAWIKDNIEEIKAGDYNLITPGERRSFAAINQIRSKGRVLPKSAQKYYQERAEEAGISLSGGMDLTNVFGTDFDWRENLQDVSLKKWVNSIGEAKEQLIFKGQKAASQAIKAGKEFVFIDDKGKEHRGLDAIEALNEFEHKIIKKFSKRGQRPIIRHQGETSFDTKGREVFKIDAENTFIKGTDPKQGKRKSKKSRKK
jgi:hypothetical protein